MKEETTMNRVIRFRAWQGGQMIYQNAALKSLARFFRVIEYDNHEPVNIMQFTGLTEPSYMVALP